MCSLVPLKPILALNCRLQIEQVNSESNDSDDDPLPLALHFYACFQLALYIINA